MTIKYGQCLILSLVEYLYITSKSLLAHVIGAPSHQVSHQRMQKPPTAVDVSEVGVAQSAAIFCLPSKDFTAVTKMAIHAS